MRYFLPCGTSSSPRRSRGLGSVLATAHQGGQAAKGDILGLPSGWDQTRLIPVGFTIGDGYSRPQRKPVEEIVTWNGLLP